MKKFFPYAFLSLLYGALVVWVVPKGYVFGSQIDWLSQHVALAETIRTACLSQHTLLPDWIGLGSGANGFQFAYYGFLRPDVLVGCLLPEISMTTIFCGYTLLFGWFSVLLCYRWLRCEGHTPEMSVLCSVLFMTAGAMFQWHRQIMFVNYLPFLLLAFMALRTGRKWVLPLLIFAICTSSFYYAPACLIAIGWYWFRLEGRQCWWHWLANAALGCGMVAMLLLPTAYTLLEYRAGGARTVTLSELLTPDVQLSGLLVSAYGIGVSLVALYAILLGLAERRWRADSLFLLVLAAFPLASFLLNGTLYARPKILMPFLPLVVLCCARVLAMKKLALWPLIVMLPMLYLWRDSGRWFWLALELCLLLIVVLISRLPHEKARVSFLLLLIAPIGLYGATAKTEKWVTQEACFYDDAALTAGVCLDARYHLDSILRPLSDANRLSEKGMRSSMYSSLTNQRYAAFYYDTLLAPIQINNRVALLSANDPFLLQLLGTRYLLTTSDQVPAGYHVIRQQGERVLVENNDVLPMAYATTDVVSQAWFEHLDAYAKLDVLARHTVVSDAQGVDFSAGMAAFEPLLTPVGEWPAGLHVQPCDGGWEIIAEQDATLSFRVDGAPVDRLWLLQCDVENLSSQGVAVTVAGIKNWLSGASAPYPNGNTTFHYKIDATEQLAVTLSSGHYRLTQAQWHSYDLNRFREKSVTPIQWTEGEANVLSGRVCLDQDGVLATTIPLQNGLHLFIDGREAELCVANLAFAGASLAAGEHQIEMVFIPPGKHAGLVLSAFSAGMYALLLTRHILRHRNDSVRESRFSI